MVAPRSRTSILARAWRVVCAATGIFFLMLQLIAPALARSDDSIWIEICADDGAVWVEVDLDQDADPAAPCPKCADCALCAVTGAASLPDMAQVERVEFAQDAHGTAQNAVNAPELARLWPETRGPPHASEIKHAPRVPMVPIQIPGGALWS